MNHIRGEKKLLIFSDCYIYGGSERLLSSVILSQLIQKNYQIYYAYRKHRYYEKGLNEQYGKNRKNFFPLFLLSNDTIFYNINKLKFNSFIKKVFMFPLWCLQKTGFYFVYNFLAIIFLLKKIQPDLVHVNNGGYPGAKSCGAFVAAAAVQKIKNVVYQVNNIAYEQKNILAKWFDKNVINKNVKFYITASQKAKEFLAKNRHFDLKKIKLVPNTVTIKSTQRNRDDILKLFSLPVNSFLICEVAFLSKRKGQIYLLEALKKIRLTNNDLYNKFKIILVGDGEEEGILKKFIYDNNLEANVFLTGYRSDSIDFINACDVFILPSISNEDMPLVVLEAMRLGKTIIASKFGGIEEEIENNVSGVLIEPNLISFSSDLAKSIIDLYINNKSEFYGFNARERYNKYFSAEHRELLLIKIYRLSENINEF